MFSCMASLLKKGGVHLLGSALLLGIMPYIHSEFKSLFYVLYVQDCDKTMRTNTTGTEKISEWIFCPSLLQVTGQ